MYQNTSELDRMYPFETRVERAYNRLVVDIRDSWDEINATRSPEWRIRIYRRHLAMLDMRVRLNGLRRMDWMNPAQSKLAYDHLAERFFRIWNA